MLATAAIAIGATPVAAMADGKRFVIEPKFEAGFALEGSHGYLLFVNANGHRQVTLTAIKGLSSAVTYTVPGRATRRGIFADFGALGRIAVRFDGSPVRGKRKREGRFSCAGRRGTYESGTFTGTIRFRGEHGFTGVDSQRARGGFVKKFRRSCEPRRSSRSPLSFLSRPETEIRSIRNMLIVDSKREGRRGGLGIIEFELLSDRKPLGRLSLAVIVATSSERVGRVKIDRLYLELGEGEEMLTSRPGADPVTATVAMPGPFSGTATYRDQKGAPPSWLGSLAVSLPGAPKMPLTGPGTSVDFCQADTDRGKRACMRRLTSRRTLAQLSGSQSQAFWDARLSWSR